MTRDTCETCKFRTSDNGGGSICTRFPPAAQIVMTQQRNSIGQTAVVPQVMSAWPPVQPSQSCGEHRVGILTLN